MNKQTAIDIFEDIQYCLNSEDWKNRTLKTIDLYRKNLKIATNKRIQDLIEIQKEYVKKYGENAEETIDINKKIDEELCKIYNG